MGTFRDILQETPSRAACRRMITIAVVVVTAIWLRRRYKKLVTSQPPEDDPNEQARLATLVRITTWITLDYTITAWSITVFCFIVPEIVWALISRNHTTMLVLALVTYFDSLVIFMFPITTQNVFEDFLRYTSSDELFARRAEAVFERMAPKKQDENTP